MGCALCWLGMAQGATGTILTFTPSITTFNNFTDNWVLSQEDFGSQKSRDQELTGGVYLTMSLERGGLPLDRGGFVDVKPENENATWTNTEVISELNSVLGTSITPGKLAGLTYAAPTTSGSMAKMSFNFCNEMEHEYTAGTDVVFYLLAATSNASDNTGKITGIIVNGLQDAHVTWALRNGSGYCGGAMEIPNGELGLIRVAGTLKERTEPVSFVAVSDGDNMSGWAMAAYTVAPEPATVTLSLLALAGLAARRRRK